MERLYGLESTGRNSEIYREEQESTSSVLKGDGNKRGGVKGKENQRKEQKKKKRKIAVGLWPHCSSF